ncbi:MAG TPA: DUF4147 domain-containing protein [Vicinamibacterales bacterium]|nr:DUF4147 domain-containing protein [Vicinamibacterales bacterium]
MAILAAGIEAARPGALVARATGRLAELFEPFQRIHVVAAGKAAQGMARAFARWAGDRIASGIVVVPAGERRAVPPGFTRLEGGHPLPTAGSVEAGAAALALADAVPRADCLALLLSGGASALMAVPAPGLDLAAKIETTRLLLAAGASIQEINAVRKHLSAIKGGWLALRAPATVTLAISDVVGDDPATIGSGPAVADPTTFEDAWRVVERYGLADRLPAAARERLERGRRGEVAETPKPGDQRLARARFDLIGGRADAMEGARREAAARGYEVTVRAEAVVGKARVAGGALVREALAQRGTGTARALLASGETTVAVRGRGRGGRNQELVLAAAVELDRIRAPGVVASVNTDGIDGPTDAAGAVADDTTIRRARERSLPDAEAVLDENDSFSFFEALGDLVRTGPTGTNVGDLHVVLLPAAGADEPAPARP